MSDCNLYGWEKVRGFHGVLLNQMEQGCLSWVNSDQILMFCRALVWHSPSPPPAPPTAPPAMSYTSSGPRRYHQTAGGYNAPARPGMVPCDTFNQGFLQERGGAPRPTTCVLLLPRGNKPGIPPFSCILQKEKVCQRAGYLKVSKDFF